MDGTVLRFRDSPWTRMPWLLPTALLLTLLSQMGFLSLLRQPPGQSVTIPRPLDVQVVELPPTVNPQASRSAPPPPAARKPKPAPEPRAEPPSPRPAPPAEAARIEPPRDPTPPAPEESTTQAPTTAATVPTAPATAPPSTAVGPSSPPPLTAVPPAASAPGPPGGTDNLSARAIYKPMPEIPEGLRRRTIDLVAVARFRVAAGGRVDVELIEATGDPDLNRALLDALRRWRFFPAMREGKPVASTVDIRIPISVR
jgi:periplasmic protein TonB